jgi:hypothetical protein
MARKKPWLVTAEWRYVAGGSLIINCVFLALHFTDLASSAAKEAACKKKEETCVLVDAALSDNAALHERIWSLEGQVKIDKENLDACMKANKRLQARLAGKKQ